MKKKMISLLLVLALVVGICPAAFAVEDANQGAKDVTVTEITREEYIVALAKDKSISYTEADRLEREQSPKITRAIDEVVRYVTLEKRAGAITNGAEYTKNVNIGVYASYLYDRTNKEYLELLSISSPYAYIPGISSDNFTFDHGDYTIEKNSSAMSSVIVLGTMVYHESGITIGAGGNIFNVSKELGGVVITTKLLTLKASFYLADCK